MDRTDEDVRTYRVVVNHEEQYSIWLADRELPRGWSDEGMKGLKSDCLAHIDRVWTDMRPLSLRRRMEAASASAANADG
jgi:MbtH protein